MCNGRTPMNTLLDGKLIRDQKNLTKIWSDRYLKKLVTVRSSTS